MMPPATPSKSALPSTMVLDGPAALDCADDCTVPDEFCELWADAAELPDDWPDDAFALPVDWFEAPEDAWLAPLDALEALLDCADVFEVPLLAELAAEFAEEAPLWADDAPACADDAPDWFEFAESAAQPLANSDSHTTHLMSQTLHRAIQ